MAEDAERSIWLMAAGAAEMLMAQAGLGRPPEKAWLSVRAASTCMQAMSALESANCTGMAQ